MNKVIYLVTTDGCSACKCQEHILKSLQEELQDFDLVVDRYANIPEFVKRNVIFTDFPTTVLTNVNEIKYHFAGTMSSRKIKELMKDIKY